MSVCCVWTYLALKMHMRARYEYTNGLVENRVQGPRKLKVKTLLDFHFGRLILCVLVCLCMATCSVREEAERRHRSGEPWRH
jgi:hypothetical protein